MPKKPTNQTPTHIQPTSNSNRIYYEQNNIVQQASLSQQLSYTDTKKIWLIHENSTYEIRAELVKFSQLLGFSYEFDEIQDGIDQEDQNWVKIDVPEEIPLNQEIAQIVSQFMNVCSHDPTTFKLGKVKSYSVKPDDACPQQISKFITSHIANLSKPSTTQLIQFCRYFHINSLLEVIYFHLATKYCCPYSQKQAKQLTNKYQVKKLNSDQAFELKVKYLDYFQNLGRKFIEIEEERQIETQKLMDDKK